MNIALIMSIAWSAAWPPVWAVIWRRVLRYILRREPRGSYWGQWVNAAAWVTGTTALAGEAPAAIVAGASLVFGAVMWWLSRRKRKRSAKLIGAKSRALLAAVVARMRETLKPRPVLRPAPGGAS